MSRPARLLKLGRYEYRQSLALQERIHALVADGKEIDTWIVVEHEPVITLGKNTAREHLLLGEAALAARGLEVVQVGRGGDATYHGPGQLVVYPIVRLARFREVAPLVGALEDATIAALAQFGLAAARQPDHRGVYVGTRAVAALGLAVRRMTSLHGLALNVSCALDYDRLIVPCGLARYGITSLAHELGREVALGEARDALLGAIAERFDLRFEREALAC
ncbi:MAG: lipoyl(octanoyl) transferase LipB [Vulcanimicrobiaceae bacterium]